MDIILLDSPLACCQCLVQQRVKYAAAGVNASGKTCLKSVAEGHEFIDLGHDALRSACNLSIVTH